MTIGASQDRSLRERPPLLSCLVRRLASMDERARMRAYLDRLDDRMLRDIGVSRADIDAGLRR